MEAAAQQWSAPVGGKIGRAWTRASWPEQQGITDLDGTRQQRGIICRSALSILHYSPFSSFAPL